MGERALKLSLKLLGIALVIAPFIVAFGMHDWNIMEAVLPDEAEMDELRESVSNLLGGGISQNNFKKSHIMSGDSTMELSIELTSPLNVPIKINDFSVRILDHGVRVGQLLMEEEEIDVEANGTVNFILFGSYSGGRPTDPQLTDMNVTIEVYGLTAKLQLSGLLGGIE